MIPQDIIAHITNLIDPEDLIKLTSDLVKINSVWDRSEGTGEKQAAEYVCNWAKGRGFDVRMEDAAPARPNVIVNWEFGPGTRVLLFEGHTDVVTPGDTAVWEYDPFWARIVDRKMYGRGAADTKGNLAAMLIAMDALKQSGVVRSGKMIGGVLCDEEDQMLGVRNFIERGHADEITGAIICEPQDGLICNMQKGALRARYTINGKMSHGAMPLSGLNTAPAVARLIEGLHDLERKAVIELGRDEHLGWPIFTPTVVRSPSAGAAQLNVMPYESIMLVDIRTIPGQSHNDIISALEALAIRVENRVRQMYVDYDRLLNLDRKRDLKIKLDILTDRPCTVTPPDDPIVRAADWATRQVFKKTPVYGGVPGATDGTFLWALKDIPIVTMGAGDREVPHQVDEWIDLDQLLDIAKIYAMTALHYLNSEDQI